MRLLFGCFIASFTCLLCGKCYAQDKVTGIQGRVFLQDNVLADSTMIVLIRLRDSSSVGTTTIGPNGVFRFNDIIADTYLLSVSRRGYKKHLTAPFRVDKNTLTVPSIELHPESSALKEVTITDKKNYIEVKPDKTILNVDKGVLANGVSVLDILGSAPGVRINSSGDILMRGGQKASIAINGRLQSLSSQDLQEQLQNLSSAGISQVELITNPSARYDAAGAGGVINIILKKGQGDGLNGSVAPSVGYGNFARTGGSLNLNYRDKQWNFFGNGSFNDYNTDHTIITDRMVGNSTGFDVDYYNKQKTYSGSYNFGGDYNIDPSHTIGFLVVGSFSNNFLRKHTVSAISNNSVPDSTLTTASMLHRRIDNINYNLNYTGKIGHTGQTISADADYNVYSRGSYEDLNSTMYNELTGTNAPTQYYRNEAPTHIRDLSVRVDYVNPLSKKYRLEAGLKSRYGKDDNVQLFDQVVGSVSVPNPNISSQFNYTEHVNSAYANFIANISPRFNYQLGLRAEHTNSDANTINEKYQVKRDYTDLFPTAAVNYTVNADHQLSLTYNHRIDRPTYQDLNPLVAYQDRYNINMGNAYLRPLYQDKIEFTHTYQKKYTATLYASLVKDPYNFTYFFQNDATGLFVTGKANLKRANTYGIELNAPVDITNWWSMNMNMDASIQHYEDYFGLLNQNSTDATFKLYQQMALPANITFVLDADYEVNTFYFIYHYKAVYSMSPSLSKKLLNNRATLYFTVKDIFNTDRNRYSSDYANLNMMGYDKKETRIYSLSFTYRFGKSTVKASRKHVTGNSEDMKRVTGGN